MITEIKLNGVVRTVRFNGYAREALGRLYSADPLEAASKLMEVLKESALAASSDLIFCGLVGDYRVRRQPVDFTAEDVALWVGEATDQEVATAVSAWLASVQERVILEFPPSETIDVPEESEDTEAAKKK